MRARTTLALDPGLLAAVDLAVKAGSAKSRNEFFARAARNHLEQHRRQAIDKAFAAMAHDPAYQAEASEIAEQFATSDWQALKTGEGQE